MQKKEWRIVKNGHLVSKLFASAEEARKWGVWNYKGDTDFKVVNRAEVQLASARRKAARNFVKTPPETLIINGHTYTRQN